MKKLILAVLLSITATSAMAQHGYRGGGYHGNSYRGGYTHNGGYRGGWVAPAVGGLIIGGLVGAAIAAPYYAPAPVYSQSAPVYVQPNPVYTPPPMPPYGYHHEQMLDANCNCYITILVPN